MDSENTQEKRRGEHLAAYQFKEGNPGRPKGARNKLGEAFVQAMHDSFEKHGAETIEKVRLEKPDQYLKVIASLLPKEMTLNVNDERGDMSDDELINRIRTLSETITAFLPDGIGGTEKGTGEAEGAEITPRVH